MLGLELIQIGERGPYLLQLIYFQKITNSNLLQYLPALEHNNFV